LVPPLAQTALLMRLQNCINRFFFGRIDECARIDNQYVRIFGGTSNFHTPPSDITEHDLCVDQVLGAA
jgi:hypothetical protein